MTNFLLQGLLEKISLFERANARRALLFLPPERIASEDEAAFAVRLRIEQATHWAHSKAIYDDLHQELMLAYGEFKTDPTIEGLALAVLVAAQSLLYACMAQLSFESVASGVQLSQALPNPPAISGVLADLSVTVVEYVTVVAEKLQQAKQAILAALTPAQE